MARTPKRWDVEDSSFWDSTGKSHRHRNLAVSIPNLLCGFSVWLYWGMIAKIDSTDPLRQPRAVRLHVWQRRSVVRGQRIGVRGVVTDPSGSCGAGRCDLAYPQFVHDRHLWRAKRQVHDHPVIDSSRDRSRDSSAKPRNVVFPVDPAGRHVGRRRRSVCIVHVKHLVLLSQTHSRPGIRPECRTRQCRRERHAVLDSLGNYRGAVWLLRR